MPRGFAPTEWSSGSNLRAGLTIDSASAVKMLEALQNNANDRAGATKLMSHFAQEWEQMVWDHQGSVMGYKRWAPLAAGWVAEKGNAAINEDTGGMKAALLGEPRQRGWTVSIMAPEYSLYAARGRFAANAKHERGGDQPHRNPAPKPRPAMVNKIAAALLEKMLEAP